MIVGRFSPKQLLLALAAISSVSGQTSSPTAGPTVSPTPPPTNNPTVSPTPPPTNNPTMAPSKTPTTNPTGSPTQTCMVTLANGTMYTASDFADATTWASYDASTSTLTCNRGRTSPVISGVCMGVTVEHCSVLECTAPATCYNVTTTSVPTVNCADDRACALGTLNSPSYLECEGPGACALTSVTLPDSAVVECEYGGCTSTKMEPTGTGTGRGITLSCTGTATTCGGSGINVGEGEITCTGTEDTGAIFPTCNGLFNANCLRCETLGSCGGTCTLNSTNGLESCFYPSGGSYGPCDGVPTASPTGSEMPTTSPAPTVAGCRVTLKDGKYMPASEFAQLYPGVSYYRGPFDETLSCLFGTACNDVTVTDCSILQCLGNSTCYNTNSIGNTFVLCEAMDSCKFADISSATEVQCRGAYSCDNTDIALTGQNPRVLCDSSYGTEVSPCKGANVKSTENNATLVCHGPSACDISIAADLENGNVLCIGVVAVPFSDDIANLPESPPAACTSSSFTASCLTCYRASETSCGAGCQYNDTSNSDGFGTCETTQEFLVLGSCPWNVDTSGSDLAQRVPSTGVLIGSAMFVLSFLVL